MDHDRRAWCPDEEVPIDPSDDAVVCPACGAPLPPPGAPVPAAGAGDVETRIDSLAVSDRWKGRFRTIARLRAMPGGVQANLRSVGTRERLAVQFSAMGFLFGFIYYFFKRMHRRAFVGIGLTFLYMAIVTVIEARLGVTFPLGVYWVPGAVAASMLVSHDYYDTLVEGRDMWPLLKRFDGRVASAAVTVVGAAVLFYAVASTYTVTIHDVESALTKDLRTRYQIEAVVTCPSAASLEPGSAFTCEVDANGETMQAQVVMRPGDTFDWSIPGDLPSAAPTPVPDPDPR